jgi:hypothetical protein
MPRGRRPRSPFKSAIAALQAGIADRLKQNATDEILIADLLSRTEVFSEVSAMTPPRKRRRRRRRLTRSRATASPRKAPSARAAVVATKPANGRRKPRSARAAVDATPDTAKPAAAPPKPAGKFDKLFAELESIRVGIKAGGEDAESSHKLRVRGNAVLKELKGRAKLPSWLTKAERMKWRRATKGPGWRPKRPPTPAPVPPVKVASKWISENGVLSRTIESR